MRTHPVAKGSPAARPAVLALALSLALAWPFVGFAADTGGDRKDCPQGQTWSGEQRKCVPANAEDILDNELTERGRQLARDGQYMAAIGVLDGVRQENSVALTYLGYSYRKLGQVERGISYYQQALAIDPDNVDTREYLGEGYVAAGRVDLARVQLAEIEKRCGIACEQYEELQSAIGGSP